MARIVNGGGFLMKKIITLAIIAIFIYSFIRYGTLLENQDNEKIMAEAFNQTNFESVESTVLFEEEYIGEYLSRENAKEVLKKLAKQMGISEDYHIEEEKKDSFGNVKLVKLGKNADTVLEIMTYENSNKDNELWTKQYLKVSLKVHNNVKQALMWKERLESLLKEYMDNPNGKIEIEGEYTGDLTVDGKNDITDRLMENTKTREIISQKGDDMYIIYGLSDIIDVYREIDGAKINLCISMDYDETTDRTLLTLSSPI